MQKNDEGVPLIGFSRQGRVQLCSTIVRNYRRATKYMMTHQNSMNPEESFHLGGVPRIIGGAVAGNPSSALNTGAGYPRSEETFFHIKVIHM